MIMCRGRMTLWLLYSRLTKVTRRVVMHYPYLSSAILGRIREFEPQAQRVWTSGVMSRLKEKVGARCNRNPISTMTATGVPPHLVLANSVAKLQRKMVCMKEDIIDKLEHLPEALKQSMLEDFQIEGTVPITRHEMQEMMRLSKDDLKNSIENSLNSIASRTIPLALIANTPIAGHENDVTTYATWTWGGELHPVPEHFEFPV
jgi:hypothetical protein